MSVSKKPGIPEIAKARLQDHMSKQKPTQLRQALTLQAANLQQKAILDNMATKVVLVLRTLGDVKKENYGTLSIEGTGEYKSCELAQDALQRIEEIITLDRFQVAEAREVPGFVYPDEKIQAIIDKAVDDIADLLLEEGTVDGV
jgi:hypothetical protein